MRRAAVGLSALICFFLAPASRELFRFLPADIAEPSWKISWIAFCLGGLWVSHRMGPRAAIAELGLGDALVRGVGTAFACTLPMLAVPLWVKGSAIRFDAGAVAARGPVRSTQRVSRQASAPADRVTRQDTARAAVARRGLLLRSPVTRG